MSDQLAIIRQSALAMQAEWSDGTSTDDTVRSRLLTILTAAERMAGENDKLRGYALATEQLAFGPPFPRQERYEGWRGDWRKKHGVTDSVMSEQE